MWSHYFLGDLERDRDRDVDFRLSFSLWRSDRSLSRGGRSDLSAVRRSESPRRSFLDDDDSEFSFSRTSPVSAG